MNIKVNHKTLTVTINGLPTRRIFASKNEYKRKVFVSSDNLIIVKLDSVWNEAEAEYAFYNELDKQDKPYFAKALTRGENWIAQEFIKFRSGRRSSEAWKTVSRLMSKYDLCDIYKHGRSSPLGETSNWGIRALNGLPVIFDYAS